jgi:hypothetical protein
MTPICQHFVDFFKDRYPHTTLDQKITVYVQHNPRLIVPLILELLRALHPEIEHEQRNAD